MERYEVIFQAAFPHPEDRRAFLHHRIKSVRISASNFRLAHLVSAGKPANLVVTTNFDELLTKALRLFGRDVIVCDHPKTTQRIDPKRDDLQVIHVHGTHWFYDCCNLKDEIQHRAEDDREDSTSMSHLLDRILFDRSPLIVGYSGWEGDVVMGALKRRLKQPLRHNLYWFSYRRADVDALPRWLKEHGHVRFVVPTESTLEKSEGVDTSSSTIGHPVRMVPSLSGTTEELRFKEATLPARQVFDALIQGFRLDEPELTKDPLDFFEKLLTNLIAPESDEDDIYLLKSVIRRVNDGATLEKQEMEKKSQAVQVATSLLGQVSGAVRGATYRDAVELALNIEFSSLSDSQCVDLENALEKIYLSIVDSNASMGLEICEMRIRLCKHAQVQVNWKSDWMLRYSKALHGKGRCLRLLGRTADAIATYDEVVRRFGDAANPALKELVAKVLVSKGFALGEEGRRTDAIATYDEVVQCFGDAAEPSLKVLVAKALTNKGVDLGTDGKFGDAVAVYDEVIRRFGDASELALKEQVSKALVNRGVDLGEYGKTTDAIASYDEVVRRFGDAAEFVLKERVAKALIFKGIDLGKADRRADAIATYDEVVRRFANATEPDLREQVAKALIFKGIDLGEDGKRTEALAVYDEVVRHFGDAAELGLKKEVAKALLTKGIALEEDSNWGEAIAAYEEIVRRFGDTTDPAMKAYVSRALLNKKSALRKEGKKR